MAVVVGHVPVEKVVIIPSHHAWVRPDAVETALNMLGCNGVKGAADVQERSKAMQASINMPFNIVRKGRGSSLRGLVAVEAVLVWVN